MKRKLLVFAACGLICSLYATRARDSAATADAERYIKESERLWAESVVTGDTSAVERFLADDIVGVDPDGSIYNKAKELEETRQGPEDFVSNHLNDVKVRFYGDTAIVQGSESWVRRTGSPLRGRYVWIDTWMKRNGKWQIVASVDVAVPDTGK